MISQQTIEEVKQRLIQTFNPLEIYLFGSYASGHPDEESDLDLCIVVDDLDQSHYDAAVEGHKVLMDMSIAKDIIVLTKDEFEQKASIVTNLFHEIKSSGKKIYARA